MNIGFIDVDGTGKYPNLALMKLSAWHKSRGDSVEWANPMFGRYDRVYMSKIFTFTPDNTDMWDCEVVKGGTGYDIHTELPYEIDRLQPDYSIYPSVDSKTAYGFLTRGCPNKCKWCVVPRKEGNVHPYMDIDEITLGGRRNKVVLMDNNVLASAYGLEQIEKIIRKGYRVDFNQALDARLITDEIARMLAKVHWLCPIRFGCDTPGQIAECERAMQMIDRHCDTPRSYLMYAMIHGNISENYERLMYFRDNKHVRVVAQPFRDLDNPYQIIPRGRETSLGGLCEGSFGLPAISRTSLRGKGLCAESILRITDKQNQRYMTTLLTITTAVLAVCAVALGWRCARLRKELNKEISQHKVTLEANRDLTAQIVSLREDCMKHMADAGDRMIQCCQWRQQADALQPFAQYKIIDVDGGGVDVVRLVQLYNADPSDHTDYYTTIKRFTDPNADFNRREAEELLDKLNEK